MHHVTKRVKEGLLPIDGTITSGILDHDDNLSQGVSFFPSFTRFIVWALERIISVLGACLEGRHLLSVFSLVVSPFSISHNFHWFFICGWPLTSLRDLNYLLINEWPVYYLLLSVSAMSELC